MEDPARIAVHILLRHSIKAASTSLAEAGSDGSICWIVPPDSNWRDLLLYAWSLDARDGSNHSVNHLDYFSGKCDWVAWAPSETSQLFKQRDQAEYFAKCVAKGQHCLGIAIDPSWLPQDQHCRGIWSR